MKEGVGQAVREGVTKKVSAEATRLVQEGYQQADALTARASNPILRAASQPAADQRREEADEKAAGIIREADRRAADVVSE